ncbi:hypothetical protein MSM1_20035 [Mycobacterium sp. SM1]|uniref:hypothetical protein n=1 Tax=Mycobacterium sp. SM1 TaxID=2816243 RepID=UPI001BCB0482|nr:hypothetical protein [Mycobacterium sp. SM1]MBS4730513.1 hypothetical protein [Mycobacterium sp. SM1]
MGAIPDREDVPWVATLRPRLVIITGTAGWLASSRRNWPDVPMLVLFSRRSPAAADAAALLKASGWGSARCAARRTAPAAAADGGLGVLCLTEPATAAVDEDLW